MGARNQRESEESTGQRECEQALMSMIKRQAAPYHREPAAGGQRFWRTRLRESGTSLFFDVSHFLEGITELCFLRSRNLSL